MPVIAIDGFSGVGKGTLRHLLAKALGFRELDSGCLYRAVAWYCLNGGVNVSNPDVLSASIEQLVHIAKHLRLHVSGDVISLDMVDRTLELRSERVSYDARVVGQLPEVRAALLEKQLSMRRAPGLVADGRDMGDIFEGPLCFRIFLHTNPEVKARRRYEQLRKSAENVTFDEVRYALLERDQADENRQHSPVRMRPDALLVDNTYMTPSETADYILDQYRIWYNRLVDEGDLC